MSPGCSRSHTVTLLTPYQPDKTHDLGGSANQARTSPHQRVSPDGPGDGACGLRDVAGRADFLDFKLNDFNLLVNEKHPNRQIINRMIVVLLFYLSELCVHVFCSLNFVGIRWIFLNSAAFSLRARLTFICATLPMRGSLRVAFSTNPFRQRRNLVLAHCSCAAAIVFRRMWSNRSASREECIAWSKNRFSKTGIILTALAIRNRIIPRGGLPFFAYPNCGSSRYSYE